ncbi:MAG TPA: hypothetical protein VFW77_01810 [Candidatus Saccharimonadales bacterium]|nr:hypothetical protein [Candidatus Saccharimonadales bacterium]
MSSSAEKLEKKVRENGSASNGSLNKGQQRFAKQAIKALSEAFHTDRANFAILRLPSSNGSAPESTVHEPKEGESGYDGVSWEPAREVEAARHVVRYVGLEPVAPDELIDQVCEDGIAVNAKSPKGKKPGREGWATPVHTVAVQHFDRNGDGLILAPTVDIPVDV